MAVVPAEVLARRPPAAFDLSEFYGAYRIDGHGRAAHDPAMMVALLLYGYAIGERSSRRLERRCLEASPRALSARTGRRITRRLHGSTAS